MDKREQKLKDKLRLLWLRFVTPFRYGLAEIERQGRDNTYASIHFWLILPTVILYNLFDGIIFYIDEAAATGLPFSKLFFDPYDIIGNLIDATGIVLLLWQFISLRKFSTRFLLATGSIMAYNIVVTIALSVFLNNYCYLPTLIARLLLWGAVFFYFWKRRGAFRHWKQ